MRLELLAPVGELLESALRSSYIARRHDRVLPLDRVVEHGGIASSIVCQGAVIGELLSEESLFLSEVLQLVGDRQQATLKPAHLR